MRGHSDRVSSLHWNSHTLARLAARIAQGDATYFTHLSLTVAVKVEQFTSMMFASKTIVWDLEKDTRWKCVE